MKQSNLAKKLFHNNIKILTFKYFILCLAYIFSIYIFINIDIFKSSSASTLNSIASVCEFFMAPIGIILFCSIAVLEKDAKIYELTYSRQCSHWKIVLLRIIMVSLELIALLIINFIILNILSNSLIPIKLLIGNFATCFYIGIISMTVSNFTHQKAAGYLTAFCYYLFEIFSKGKYIRTLYLFSMIYNEYVPKIILLALSIILIILNLFYIKKTT